MSTIQKLQNRILWPKYQENEQTVFEFGKSGFNLTMLDNELVKLCAENFVPEEL